ncbi:MAG TPA: hypothetical protein P5568_05780 [Acidobacteriota bacterium]|nr:hypothetical protein [Acidobacteriota bacterium]HRR57247.1 hypothetical protein [Acidobacteriota bacterium]HRV07962.1 hypothetical protein [Acidobacteriota bacterium]
MEMLPDQVYAYSNNPMLRASPANQGVEPGPPTPLASYFREYRPPARYNHRTDVQITRWLEFPEEAKRRLQLNEYLITRVFHPASPFQVMPSQQCEAALSEVTLLEEGGKWVEVYCLPADSTSLAMPGIYGVLSLHQSPVHTLVLRALAAEAEAFARWAPVIMRSAEADVDWLVGVTRMTAELTRQALHSQLQIFQRMQEISRTLSEVDDMIVDSYYRRSRAMDRVFEDYGQAVRGVETYVAPGLDFPPVEPPLGCDRVWTDGNEYLLTNDPRFDPNELDPQRWTPMEPVEH